MSGRGPADTLRDTILRLCGGIKNDAVSLVDVYAPPDFILHAPIGLSDGQVCNLIISCFHLELNPGCLLNFISS